MPYPHQVDLDANNENIAPDSLGTPEVRRKTSPVSHLVFTPIVRPPAPPSIQLESVHEKGRDSSVNGTALQDITNQCINPFEEVSPEQFREEAKQTDTEAQRIQRKWDEAINEIINHPNSSEVPQKPPRIRRPPTVHPPGANISNTRPTIQEDTREIIEKQTQYQLAKERAICIDNEINELTSISIALQNGMDKYVKLTTKPISYEVPELI